MDFGDLSNWAAAGVAVIAAGYAARAGKTAQESLHQQQTPEFEVLVEDVNGDAEGTGGWPRLMVRLVDAPAKGIGQLRVELITNSVTFADDQNGVKPGGHQRSAFHTLNGIVPTAMQVGDRARWRLDFGTGPGQPPPMDQVEVRVIAFRHETSFNGTMVYENPWARAETADVEAARKAREHSAGNP